MFFGKCVKSRIDKISQRFRVFDFVQFFLNFIVFGVFRFVYGFSVSWNDKVENVIRNNI